MDWGNVTWEVDVVDLKAVDQRLSEVEEVLRTSIVFNLNAAAVIGRRLAAGNEALANAIAQDLRDLKSASLENVNTPLLDQYIDSLITGITGKT